MWKNSTEIKEYKPCRQREKKTLLRPYYQVDLYVLKVTLSKKHVKK